MKSEMCLKILQRSGKRGTKCDKILVITYSMFHFIEIYSLSFTLLFEIFHGKFRKYI